jgi:hypothetical protein
LPYSVTEQPAKNAKAAYEELQLHRKNNITSSNDLKMTIAVKYVKASVFPLSTVVSHLLTSVDRNAVVTDEQ